MKTATLSVYLSVCLSVYLSVYLFIRYAATRTFWAVIDVYKCDLCISFFCRLLLLCQGQDDLDLDYSKKTKYILSYLQSHSMSIKTDVVNRYTSAATMEECALIVSRLCVYVAVYYVKHV